MTGFRRQAPWVVCILAAASYLFPGAGDATVYDPWFPTPLPDPTTISEEQFHGADARYLQLLRTLASTVAAMDHKSLVWEHASDTLELMTDEAYREQLREDAEKDRPKRDVTVTASGDPDYPILRTQRRMRMRAQRQIASAQALQVHWWFNRPDRQTHGTFQRAWGGSQQWRVRSGDTDPPTAQLAPAWAPQTHHLIDLAWDDVDMFARMLAMLLDLGPPDRITSTEEDHRPRLAMQWRLPGHETLQLTVDPKHDFLPAQWREIRLVNEQEGMRFTMERARSDSEDPEDTRAYIDNFLADRQPYEYHMNIAIDLADWRKTAPGAWLPEQMHREQYIVIEMVEDPELEDEGPPPSVTTYLDTVTWTQPSAAHRPAVFTPPPGYETYTGQQWVDLIVPADPRDRGDVVAALRDGVTLTTGPDLMDNPRWTVESVDSLLLQEWPLLPGDVLLEAGLNFEVWTQPTVLVPKDFPTPQHVVDRIALAITNARHDERAILRIARDTTLIDVICWVPKSESVDDRLALQQRILKAHQYPPLPSDRLTAFAEAVLAATDDLVRGAAD